MRQQERNQKTRTLIAVAAMSLAIVSVAQMTSLAAPQSPRGPSATFASPADAVSALIGASRKFDIQAVEAVFGPGSEDVVESGDPVADKLALERFVAAYDKKSALVPISAMTTTLHVGDEDWEFPIPLVREGGRWRFNVAAGRDELIDRRIGRNETNAAQASRAYVDAQREYGSIDRDGDGILEYAQRFISTMGLKDGLYWPTQGNEPPSPLGEFFAEATDEGYFKDVADAARTAARETPTRARPYYGYYYKILTSQGPSAPGGAYDYIVSGNMIGGFAMVAYPAEYGVSGVMTFIVNHDGAVYQKDLGPETDYLEIARFDPDSTWRRIQN